MTFVFALYRIAPCYIKGIQNVYFDASNTEETSIPQKVDLHVYVYKKYTSCGVFWVQNVYTISICFFVRYTFCILQGVPNYYYKKYTSCVY